jgi:hypothetical protein
VLFRLDAQLVASDRNGLKNAPIELPYSPGQSWPALFQIINPTERSRTPLLEYKVYDFHDFVTEIQGQKPRRRLRRKLIEENLVRLVLPPGIEPGSTV